MKTILDKSYFVLIEERYFKYFHTFLNMHTKFTNFERDSMDTYMRSLEHFHVKSTLVTKYNMLLLFKLLFFCYLSVIIFGVTGIPFSPSSGLNSRDFILSSLPFRQDKISLEDNQEKILVSSARVYNLSNLFLLTIFVVKLRLLIEA